MARIALADFSGGLNLRDSPTELAPNETPSALNWTLDVRGQLRLRPGWEDVVALPGSTQQGLRIYYSPALDQWLAARYLFGSGTIHLYTRPGDLSGVWTDRGVIANTSGAFWTAFVDFPGPPTTAPKVVLTTASTHFAGAGIYTWDGTTLTQVSSTISGSALAVWRDRVWLLGYPTTDSNGNPTRLFACAIGDAAAWTVAAGGLTVDIRIKDAERLTALELAGGALVVFKQRSAYRIIDGTTGEPSLLDAGAGCFGPRALATLHGRIHTWGMTDLYTWDGIGPGKSVGGKVRPVFLSSEPYHVDMGPIAVPVEDRILFGYGATTPGVTDALLEYDPQNRWVMKHQVADTGRRVLANFAKKPDGTVYAAAQNVDQLLSVGTGTPGSDSGTLYANNYRTPWLQPGGGKVARILRAQVEGLLVTGGTNTLTLRVYKDWDLTSFDSYSLTADLRGGDAADEVESSIVQSLGHSRAFAFEFVGGTAAGAAAVNALALDPLALEAA